MLRDLTRELLEADDADLLEQERSFRTMLVPDLKPQEFADMYAQTAAYGLFTARVFEHTTLFGAAVEALPDSLKSKAFSLEKAAYLIPKANPFLRQFFQHVASPNLNPQLRWLDWLLKEKFAKPEGLADPSALILDPATGTATFLRKVIDIIHQRVAAHGNAGLRPG